MATTVHAGPSWANALQSASDTAGTYRKATQDKEAHRLSQRAGEQALSQGAEAFEMDKQAFAQNAKLITLQAEGEQLEQMIRLDQRQKDKEAATVRAHLLRGQLDPEKLLREAEEGPDELAKLLEKASPEDRERTFTALAIGRRAREDTDEAFQLASYVGQTLSHAAVGTGDAVYQPDYLKGLQRIQQEMTGWRPLQGRDPSEIRAQLEELEKQQTEFVIRHDAINAGLKEYRASFGEGSEMAPVWSLLRAGKFDEAADFAYMTKYPHGWKKTREDAQAEVIDQRQSDLADKIFDGALLAGYEPGTPQFEDYVTRGMAAGRRIYGPDVVPYSEQEQFDQEIQAFIAAGVPEEEAFQAIQAGLTYEEYAASQGPQRALNFARPPANGKAAKPAPQEPPPADSLRPDGTKKDKGFLGEQALPDGRVATEYSVGVELDGKEVDIPTLVPTLTKAEVDLMVNDVIPNGKPIPDAIMDKAVAHARKRIKAGKSPFYSSSEKAP